jgi:hypothetical protein
MIAISAVTFPPRRSRTLSNCAPLLWSEAFGSGAASLLAAKPAERDRCRIFAGIVGRGIFLDNAGRYINDELCQLVSVSRTPA